MRLFFIAPWPAADPLSASTVAPHLAQLVSDSRVEQIRYFSREDGRTAFQNGSGGELLPAHVIHQPLKGLSSSPSLYRRVKHHQSLLRTLLASATMEKPDMVICRGTASIFGDFLHRRLSIPYVVESFEPHAHYMLQTGTWSRWDPRFVVQSSWEARVKRRASALITVSHGYAKYLRVQENISPNRLFTVPCWVDRERYRLNPDARFNMRDALGIGDRLAVVYAGKFGGIYAPPEALAMLKSLQQALGRDLFVILLTSHDVQHVKFQLAQAGFSPDQSFVGKVPYDRVVAYLNAADFSLSFWSAGPWSFASSPIKHGEYWACGLPLLMAPGVGDEAQWLEVERVGAIANFSEPRSVIDAAQRLKTILAEPGHRQRIRAIGLRERGPEPLRRVYGQLLSQFSGIAPDDG